MSFTNRNVCKSFYLNGNNVKTRLSDQECSEVVVRPLVDYTFYDHQNPSVGFLVKANTEFTFLGLINSSQLSATGNGDLYYRTHMFSNMPGV